MEVGTDSRSNRTKPPRRKSGCSFSLLILNSFDASDHQIPTSGCVNEASLSHLDREDATIRGRGGALAVGVAK